MSVIEPYKVKKVVTLNLLGCSTKFKNEIYDRIGSFVDAGVKFAILGFDNGFYLQCFNMSDEEQRNLMHEITHQYNMALGVKK